MSARKWPFYTMVVGQEIVIPDRRWLQKAVSRHGGEKGKVFVTRRRPEGRVVRRVA